MSPLRLGAIVLLCVALVGCPKERRGLKASRKAVELSAETLKYADKAYSVLYGQAAHDALGASDSRDAYNREMAPWDKGVDALRSTKLSLLLLETSLDAWEAGIGKGQFIESAKCFLESLLYLDLIFDDLGVQTPKDFLQQAIAVGLELLKGFDAGSGLCSERTAAGVPAGP